MNSKCQVINIYLLISYNRLIALHLLNICFVNAKFCDVIVLCKNTNGPYRLKHETI